MSIHLKVGGLQRRQNEGTVEAEPMILSPVPTENWAAAATVRDPGPSSLGTPVTLAPARGGGAHKPDNSRSSGDTFDPEPPPLSPSPHCSSSAHNQGELGYSIVHLTVPSSDTRVSSDPGSSKLTVRHKQRQQGTTSDTSGRGGGGWKVTLLKCSQRQLR